MSSSPYLPGRLGFASTADVDEFVATLRRYERGELSADAWRAFRLVRGVYGQRQPEVQMLRVKIPQGILGPPQLRALADVGATYGDGRCHITTRQNAQFYQLALGRVEAAMRELAAVGLTTREACGHSVRSITACPLAGVDAAAVFDVTPYADALTRYLLRGPLSSTLPRKFKIAFEGCHRDCVKAAINDLGFIARRDASGARGFLVLGGGGLSTLPRSGPVLVPFLPAAELLGLSEAVVRVFHREGDRKNKKKARLKWVIQDLGWDEVQARILNSRRLLPASSTWPGGIPEVGTHHDLTHVLTGYDTDPAGETQIAAFYAGYFKEDPFSFLFMVLVMFHVGVAIGPPMITAAKGQFDPEKVLRAMERGSKINVDLTDHWDYWSVMSEPIDAVRARYNIVPAS